jgi:protein TonB
MKLDAWTTESPVDSARRKRLTVGYAVGAATVAVALLFITYSAHGQAFEPDDTLDVTLSQPPVEAPAQVEPEPEPEKPRIVKKAKRRAGAKRGMATPEGVPDEVPAEADPGGNPYEGDLDDVFEGGGGGATQAAAPKVRTAAKPAVRAAAPAPVLVSEREASVPPTPISRRPPTYPPEARSEGVEAVVVVRFLVTKAGSVSNVSILRGHELLNAAVIAAVKQWRFSPGSFEGNPVAMWQTATFPFRLRS